MTNEELVSLPGKMIFCIGSISYSPVSRGGAKGLHLGLQNNLLVAVFVQMVEKWFRDAFPMHCCIEKEAEICYP